MLIQCLECGLSVSDKAMTCPHCGYPVKHKLPSKAVTSKRMRLPNGFGRITEIKGKRLRKPFRVIVTDDKDDNGKPIGKLLKPNAYFETYNDAYAALIEYHKNPYDLSKDITMQELYDRWFENDTASYSTSYIRDIKSAWSYCQMIYDMPLRQVRGRHIRNVLENAYKINKDGTTKKASPTITLNIKKLMNRLYSYALEYELVDRNYAKEIAVSKNVTKELKENVKSHHAFTDLEISSLWNNINDQIARMIIIQCYMGWRPGELCEIENSKINLSEWCITGGKKTSAGKNRIVPIHTKIRSLIQEEYAKAISTGSNYLFVYKPDKYKHYIPYTYDHYLLCFNRLKAYLKLDEAHKPHDPRKHFITMAKKSGVDEYVIKLVVGHSIADITESVYTERNLDWLHKEIAKIP